MSINRLPELRLRLSELTRLRGEYVAQRKPHFVAYLDGLISDIEREIARIQDATTPVRPER